MTAVLSSSRLSETFYGSGSGEPVLRAMPGLALSQSPGASVTGAGGWTALSALAALALTTDTAVVNAGPGATNKSDIFHELRRQNTKD